MDPRSWRAFRRTRAGRINLPQLRPGEAEALYKADRSINEEGAFRPTGYMEKVSRDLELHAEPPSRNRIESEVIGKAEYVRLAIDTLVSEGYAVEFAGANRARLVKLERAFSERNE